MDDLRRKNPDKEKPDKNATAKDGQNKSFLKKYGKKIGRTAVAIATIIDTWMG